VIRRRPIKRTRLRRPRKTVRRSLKAQADKLCGAIVRARGKCERCGSTEMLQWCHGIGRAYLQVRWDFKSNGFCLCKKCHCYMTYRPIQWQDWMIAKLGQKEYDMLRARALTVGKVDMRAIVLALERLS
jgi:hypothetical protein